MVIRAAKDIVNTIRRQLLSSDTDERTKTARNNVIYSTLYRGIGMILGLWMVPLTLGYLNSTKYGIWLTLTALISWLNFFDIGLGNGLRNKLGEAFAKNDKIRAREYVSTTYAFMSIIVFAFFILFVVCNQFIDWNRILNVPSNFDENLKLLVVIVFFLFCFRFVFGLILVVLNADQKLSTSGFIDLLTNVLSIAGVYIISKTFEGSLFMLGGILSFVSAITVAMASTLLFRTKYRAVRPSFGSINFKLTRDLTTLSFQFFVLQIVVLLIFFSNNIIITQLLNPDKVTEFNIVHKYFNLITTVSVLILNPFWSAATHAYSSEDFGWLKKSAKKLIVVWALLSIVTFFMVLISPYVYSWWLMDQIHVPFSASVLMGVYVILLSWTNTFLYLINGIGKIRLQLFIYVAMAMLVVPMSFFFIKELDLGFQGSILSTIICLVPAAIFIPLQFRLIANRKATGIFNK